MRKRQQEPRDLIKKDRQRDDDTMVAVKERSDSFCERRHSKDVVIPALREIEKSSEAGGSGVWIHVEANRAWLTIGRGTRVSGRIECTERLKYQVEVSGQAMISSLCRMIGSGPQKEHRINDEHEIAGDASGKNIADVTSKDIVDDFMAAFEAYAGRENDQAV